MPLYLFTNIIIGFTVNCGDLLTHFREYIVNWCCCFSLVEYLFIYITISFLLKQTECRHEMSLFIAHL